MIGLLILTHGKLGDELLACAESVVGKRDAVRAVGLSPSEGPEAFEKRIRQALEELMNPAGVLVLVDMLGGTPSNACLRLAKESRFNFDLVTGVSMPMAVTALANRSYMPLAELAQKLVDDAARGAQRPLQQLREHLKSAEPE